LACQPRQVICHYPDAVEPGNTYNAWGSVSLFFIWLEQQSHRSDFVGAFAIKATLDASWPRRCHKLHALLRFVERHPSWENDRTALKAIHAEWRVEREKQNRLDLLSKETSHA
tara:strand:- start:1490 stop:1828 length:339 start_codon:yes stop_codon:yes gene_type:complete